MYRKGWPVGNVHMEGISFEFLAGGEALILIYILEAEKHTQRLLIMCIAKFCRSRYIIQNFLEKGLKPPKTPQQTLCKST
jgi:hypothetical protein